ncbi:hypothetical protein JFL43_17110 [Viridibacillus sp. YIM B01967]|uniref:DUF4352 domain-containing protein n=1 Tax=Viridibacillus soli TaxID=2798301 RepID=A0ABS1HBA2_9BACL|nr:hypothetical protein [Viridibacillus soli]MBK3496544.1 hypothetical protein [Viridibacillus soli]
MKKKPLILVLMFAIISIGIFSLVKSNPPLVSGTIATSGDKHTVVVVIGNKSFSDVQIKEVLINNNEKPLKQKIQLSNPLKGFIISDDIDGEERDYEFINIEDVKIQSKTSPSTQLEKANNGTATESDKSYGLTVFYNKEISKVIIKYSYLGLSFGETVSIHG